MTQRQSKFESMAQPSIWSCGAVIAGNVTSYLEPTSACNSAVAIPALGKNLLLDSVENAVEIGAWLAVKTMCGERTRLHGGEKWIRIWAVVCRLSGEGAWWVLFGIGGPDGAAMERWTFLKDGGEAVLAEAALDRRRKHRRISELRLVEAARRLGSASRWDLGSRLLESAAGAGVEAMGATKLARWFRRRVLLKISPTQLAEPAHQRWRAHLLVETSSFFIDQLYASTYVRAADDDSARVLAAFEYAREAVGLLRGLHDEDHSPPPLFLPRVVSSTPQAQSIDALRALGRAAALAAQHAALGALTTERREASDLFEVGERAFQEAIQLATHDHWRAALAKAGLAELWYCRASGLVRAGDSAAVRDLGTRSIQLTKEALHSLEAMGLGTSREAATMFKDLGKVCGFIAQLFVDRQNADLAKRYLVHALRLTVHFDGIDHRNTANVARLIALADLDEPGDYSPPLRIIREVMHNPQPGLPPDHNQHQSH